MKSNVLALRLVLLSIAAAANLPAHADSKPCALVCLMPDEKLDAKKCACVKQADFDRKTCSLICRDPQTLDADKCVCIGKN